MTGKLQPLSAAINFSEAKADPVANDEDAAKEKVRARVSTILWE